MTTIDKLLEYVGFDGYDDAEEAEAIEDLLYELDAYEVEESFSEGSRWSNYKTTVYSVENTIEKRYFAVIREVPATEMQDGGDFTYAFHEVWPREKTIVVYE